MTRGRNVHGMVIFYTFIHVVWKYNHSLPEVIATGSQMKYNKINSKSILN